jgi:hypothetical protein
MLLTPILIILGAYAVLRAGGLLLRVSGIHLSFASNGQFSVPPERFSTLAAGIAAVAVGVVFTFTLARFLRLLPGARRLIVGLQLAVAIVLIVVLVITHTYSRGRGAWL